MGRKYWQLLVGSTVLLHRNPFTSWLVGDGHNASAASATSALQPWVHFVPISFDLSDLASHLAWLREHEAEAEMIADAGHSFAQQHLTYEAVLLYVGRLVQRYA